jgi:hypothetical protein
MPVDIYVHLREGTDVLLKQVTATPTTVHLPRVSAPYRDLGHRGRDTDNQSVGGLDLVKTDHDYNTLGPTASGVSYAPGTFIKGEASPQTIPTGLLVDTLTKTGAKLYYSAPDNVTHIPPRQVDVLVSHYYFLTSSGINSYIPCEDVITWSENPRQ